MIKTSLWSCTAGPWQLQLHGGPLKHQNIKRFIRVFKRAHTHEALRDSFIALCPNSQALTTTCGSKSTLFTSCKGTHTQSSVWRQFGCWRGSLLGLQAAEIQFLLWAWNSSVYHQVLSWRSTYLFKHLRYQTLQEQHRANPLTRGTYLSQLYWCALFVFRCFCIPLT